MYDKTDSAYSLPDDTPHVSNQDERPPPSDRGLLGLVLIARYLQIPATPDGLHLQFAPAVKELDRLAILGEQVIQLSPKSLGFRVRAARADLNNLNNAVLPALCKNTYGEYFILVQIADIHDGPIAKDANADNSPKNLQYLVHILSGMSGQRKLSAIELSGFWDDESILMSPYRSPFFGLHREFNLKWFIQSLINYRRFFGEMLLVSLPYIILSVFITPILKHWLAQKFQYRATNQSFWVEAVIGEETIKSLALELQMQKRWGNILAHYVMAGFQAQSLDQISGQAASFIQKIAMLQVIWFGAHQVIENNLSVGQLVAFNMIASRVSGPILKLTQLWQDFQQAVNQSKPY